MFKEIEYAEALTVSKGVYRPVKVYEGPQGGLFVKYGSGFVRVKENGSTSVVGLHLENLIYDEALYRDQFGRLCVTPAEGRKALRLEGGDTMKLLPAD